MFGPGGMDHVDPAASTYALAGSVIRLYARQLFTLAGPDWTPVPDLAVEIPTGSNGGVSRDGTTYTVRLRRGVCWDTRPPREVTAADFVRGFKRMGNPVAGSGMVSYFTSTLCGMAEFCASFTKVPPEAQALAEYQATHKIQGVEAIGSHTLRFQLVRPTNDFLQILCMLCASAAPVEYDEFLPDSAEFAARIHSDGPYRMVGYEPGIGFKLLHNPAWNGSTDPIRRQYLDAIEVRIAAVDDTEVGKRIRLGGADLGWGSPVVDVRESAALMASDYPAYAHNPYLSLNHHGVLRDRRLRLAIAYAVDKRAVADILASRGLGIRVETAGSVIPPGNMGYRPVDPYATPGSRGDPGRAHALLTDAGYVDGLDLVQLHRQGDAHPAVAAACAAALARAGIRVRLKEIPQSHYYALLHDPAIAATCGWDLAAVGWTPDWYGNNGRTAVQPLFETNDRPGTDNYGGYSASEVDQLIVEALGARDLRQAELLWGQVDELVMRDVAVVPLTVFVPVALRLASARVRGALPIPHLDRWFDLSRIWLESDTEEQNDND